MFTFPNNKASPVLGSKGKGRHRASLVICETEMFIALTTGRPSENCHLWLDNRDLYIEIRETSAGMLTVVVVVVVIIITDTNVVDWFDKMYFPQRVRG